LGARKLPERLTGVNTVLLSTAKAITDLERRTMSEDHRQLDDSRNALSPVTAKEAAAVLGCNIKSIYDGIKRGEIPAIRLGRMVLIPRPAFERMLRGEAT
jgi:excisionase family DNA binding protein